MLGLLALPAAAEPWLDPIAARGAACAREQTRDVFVGDGRWLPADAARKLGEACPELAVDLAPELDAEGVVWTARPWARLAGGDLIPDNQRGDAEVGLLSGTTGVAGTIAWGGLSLHAEPELSGGALGGPSVGEVRLATLWAEARWRGLSVGMGARDRWLGPGRHGALVLSDNARAPWLATSAVEGRLPGWFDRLGRFRVEAGAGLLAEPRDDVARPGYLLMDLRWLPVPYVEIGATRASIFGGEGRPPVDVGQLLLPTEPHVYDDPDKLLPDQNELAALDLRVTLPIGTLTGLPIRVVEGWWQYGGEDMIVRELGPVPYPSLAGVGNLYGGAVTVGPVVVTGEYSALLDDYFRWYVGHRVYHDGFTQGGRVMGHSGGPDSETAFGSVAWEGASGRARLWGDWTRRVGVIEALNDKLFTLMTEERGIRAGVDAAWRLPRGGWLGGGYAYQHVTGDDFVPGSVADRHRVYVSVSPAVVFGGPFGGTR